MEMLLSSTIEVAIGQEKKKNKQPYSNTRQLFHLSVWPTESSSFFLHAHSHPHHLCTQDRLSIRFHTPVGHSGLPIAGIKWEAV